MTENAEELRARAEDISSKIFEKLERRSGPYRSRSFEFEKLAVEYSHRGFQTLTYLNGGALVGIPAALAFLRADVSKGTVILTAALFIIGLIAVVLSQTMAFFVMAARGEMNDHEAHRQADLVAAEGFPIGDPERIRLEKAAASHTQAADVRRLASNRFRVFGLRLYTASVIFFLLGCCFGAFGVMTARDRPEPATTTTVIR